MQSQNHYFQREILVEHDVVRLDVAVRRRLVVDVVDAVEQLQKVMPREAHGKGASGLEEGEQVGAGAMFEDDVGDVLASLAESRTRRALLIVHAVDLHDVGVHKLGKRH